LRKKERDIQRLYIYKYKKIIDIHIYIIIYCNNCHCKLSECFTRTYIYILYISLDIFYRLDHTFLLNWRIERRSYYDCVQLIDYLTSYREWNSIFFFQLLLGPPATVFTVILFVDIHTIYTRIFPVNYGFIRSSV